MAMQDAPPLPEESPVYQYQFDLERHFQLAFEQLALERQQGRELLAQGVLEMQRLAASIFRHALQGNNRAEVTTPVAIMPAQMVAPTPGAIMTAHMAGLSLA